MIVSSSRRWVLAWTARSLHRYDRRWRRTVHCEPFDGADIEVHEGDGHVLVVHTDVSSGVTKASVRSADVPAVSVAEGIYENDKWQFSGDASGWSKVPEYLLVPDITGHRSLLRIADEAVVDPLDEIPDVDAVVALPGSRLVVLGGSGHLSVYEPIRGTTAAHYRLASEEPHPQLRLREHGKELWVNDRHTLLKLDTVSWEVLDAAGSDVEGSDVEGGDIRCWQLSDDESSCVVVRSGDPCVLLLGADDLMPVVRLEFAAVPDDVTILPDGGVLGFRSDVNAFMRPLRRESLPLGEQAVD